MKQSEHNQNNLLLRALSAKKLVAENKGNDGNDKDGVPEKKRKKKKLKMRRYKK